MRETTSSVPSKNAMIQGRRRFGREDPIDGSAPLPRWFDPRCRRSGARANRALRVPHGNKLSGPTVQPLVPERFRARHAFFSTIAWVQWFLCGRVGAPSSLDLVAMKGLNSVCPVCRLIERCDDLQAAVARSAYVHRIVLDAGSVLERGGRI